MVARQSPRSFGSACARSVVDGAIAAHEIRQEILHFPFPRVAQPDAQPLARRGGVEVEPGLRHELRQRVDVGHVNPMRPAVIGDAERARVGETAPTHAVGRLEEHKLAPRCSDATCGGDASGASAGDDNIDAAGSWKR